MKNISFKAENRLFSNTKTKYKFQAPFPAKLYLFKVKNRNSGKRCGICSKLTIKTPE